MRTQRGRSNLRYAEQPIRGRRRAIPGALRLPLLALTLTAAIAALLLTRAASPSPVLEALAVLAALVAAAGVVLLLASWFLSLLSAAAAYLLVPVTPPGLERVAAVIEQIEHDRRAAAGTALAEATSSAGPHPRS